MGGGREHEEGSSHPRKSRQNRGWPQFPNADSAPTESRLSCANPMLTLWDGPMLVPPGVIQVHLRVFCPLSAPCLPFLLLPPGRSVLRGQDPGSAPLGQRGASRQGRAEHRRECSKDRGRPEPRSTVTVTTKVPWVQEGTLGFTEPLGLRRAGVTGGHRSRGYAAHTPGSWCWASPPAPRPTDWPPRCSGSQWAGRMGKLARGPQPTASTGHGGAGRLGPLGSWGSFWDRGLANWMHSRVTGKMEEGRPSIRGLRGPAPASMSAPPTPCFRSGSQHPSMGTVVVGRGWG